MRFMMLMLAGGEPRETAGREAPGAEDVGAMASYNEQLTRAGVLLALDGLHPPSKGARVTLADGQRRVTEGPFDAAKEIVGGYWVIDVKSKQEAVEWASRCPLGPGDAIEVRQVYELSDLSAR